MRNLEVKQKGSLIAAFVICILYIFTIAQIDCNTITTWGYDLLDSISVSRLREYPVFTYEMHQMPTNYNLFVNVITAIWLVPAFLVGNVAGLFSSMIIYDIWYKVLVLVIFIIDLLLFNKILKKMDFDTDRRVRGIVYFMLSAVLCVTVLGKGQVDIYSVTFAMLAVIYFLDCKYVLMSLFFGLALCIKPFVILFIVPFYLLMISKTKGRIILYGFITLLPYGIDALITKLLMPRYYEMKAITSQMFKDTFGASRVEEIFDCKINNVLVFLSVAIIICFVCLRIGRLEKTKSEDYILFPTLMYVSYAILVSDTCYWFIVIIPALIVMGLKMKHIEDFELLYFGSNLGVVIYTYYLEAHYRPGTNYTIFDGLGLVNKPFVLYENLSTSRTLVYEIGATLFVICMLVICVLFILENKGWIRKNGNDRQSLVYSKICFMMQYVPVIVYLLVNYISIG